MDRDGKKRDSGMSFIIIFGAYSLLFCTYYAGKEKAQEIKIHSGKIA
jgi:hypothetical protein